MKSPCVQICVVHPSTGYCVGCNRTMLEIADWARLDTPERERIMAELPTRENAHKTIRIRPSQRTGRQRGRRITGTES